MSVINDAMRVKIDEACRKMLRDFDYTVHSQCSGSRDDELGFEGGETIFLDDLYEHQIKPRDGYRLYIDEYGCPGIEEESKESEAPTECICESKVLFNKGCQCEYGNEELIKEKYNG